MRPILEFNNIEKGIKKTKKIVTGVEIDLVSDLDSQTSQESVFGYQRNYRSQSDSKRNKPLFQINLTKEYQNI